ncbi:DUF4333 domain-containing protein [Williamsia sp. CHRR-6]|uniref:DUF4333 domain-containing protein n=1 Tax=Williamsia sp. CHRR-6 TaxID=2835871 RepID=UPI001BDA6285|nr:DUF4333 domain-containing protein [Williamsia sp. CHRR-6]MBT0568122.1 DUF4333 domain-containing protein [Williamsia sp. CHRR-6]
MTDPQNPEQGDRNPGTYTSNPWAQQPDAPTQAQPWNQPPAPQAWGQPQGVGGVAPNPGNYDQSGQYGQPDASGAAGYGYGQGYPQQPQTFGQQGFGTGYTPDYSTTDGSQAVSGQGGYGGYGNQNPYGAQQFGVAQPSGFGGPGQDQFASMNRPLRDRKPLLISIGAGVVAVIVAVLAVTAFWIPGFAVTKKLSQSAVESGVKSVLTKDYQATDVTEVSCPSGQKVKKGDTFDCSVTISGAKQKVTVTFLDDDGAYEVGRPSAN